MKYEAVIETDDFRDFEFFEDGYGKYLHGIDAGSVNGEWIALYFTEYKQELSRDMEEIEEVINCDVDAETKCKMISNILTAKPHYFAEQDPCDKCVYSTKDGYCQYDDISETVPPLESCEDTISRQAAIDKAIYTETEEGWSGMTVDVKDIEKLPPVTPGRGWEEMTVPCENCGHDMTFKIAVCGELNTGHCKECKYFEYDSVAKVDGIPLIVAHEICNKWGDGCKTKEDGYCFLFEPRESEVNNE